MLRAHLPHATSTVSVGPQHTWWLRRQPRTWHVSGAPEIDSRLREGGTCLRLHSGPRWARTLPSCRLNLLIGRVPTLGDGQVDFEEFVTLLGPKLSTSGIPERFHGTDFDTVFWKVCHGLLGPRAVYTVESHTGASERLGPVCRRGMTTPGFCPLDILSLRGHGLPGGAWCWSRSRGMQRVVSRLPEAGGLPPARVAAASGWGLWWWWRRPELSPPPQVRHAEADSGRAEAAALRHLLRAPVHEGHREHYHDGGGEPPGHG